MTEVDLSFPGALFPASPTVAEAALPPSRLVDLLAGVEDYRASIGVGLAWVPIDAPDELERLRARAAELGGLVPVIRGEGGLGEADVPAPHVQQRVRRVLDPAGTLAPGRGWGPADD